MVQPTNGREPWRMNWAGLRAGGGGRDGAGGICEEEEAEEGGACCWFWLWLAWDRIWLVAWMNSCALALLAMFASSILKSRAVNAKTPPVVQSTPVCRLQGRAGAAGGGGGGGGLLADEEETDEEEEGSDEDMGRDREARPQPADEDELGGEARDLGASSGGECLAVGVDRALLSPAPCGVDRLDGLDAGSAGLVWVGQSSARNEGSGVLQLLSTV